MKAEKALMILLLLLFAALMSIPFLVPHCGVAALFGLVPLLCMERIATYGKYKHFWTWHYSAFVLWNAATTFWVCNATVGGGIFAVLANSLQMSLIFGLFRASKKVFRGVLPYLFLAFLWIAWERAYFSAQISWPWLTLGNAFARTTSLIQWYEFTGSLGGSLWIWATNLSVFGLMVALSNGSWSKFNAKAKTAAIAGTVILFAGPTALSMAMYKNYEEPSEPLQVAILQPNIDPYHKFQALPQDQQNAILAGQMQEVLKDRKDSSTLLILAPETFTSDVYTNDIQSSKTFRRLVSELRDYPGANLLFGAATRTVTESRESPDILARKWGDGVWVLAHNSAIMTDRNARSEIFHKSKLVVGVESTPYPRIFTKIDDKLGGVMGRDKGQEEISLLNVEGTDGTKIPVGCAICYESVYGEYCTDYIRKGARLLTVITNDAWWGDTPGYRQHLSYAALRAIETRRDIARCGNTGISAIINSRGDITAQTPWWEKTVLQGKVNLSSAETFFVRNGDITGRLCTFMAIMLFLAMAVRFLTGKRA